VIRLKLLGYALILPFDVLSEHSVVTTTSSNHSGAVAHDLNVTARMSTATNRFGSGSGVMGG
jgi:hypothetical protein